MKRAIVFIEKCVFVPHSNLTVQEALDKNAIDFTFYTIKEEFLPKNLIASVDKFSLECNSGGVYFSQYWWENMKKEYIDAL